MPQSLSQVYSHIIFSTKNRQPLIDKSIQSQLFDYIGGVCKSLNCNPIQVGGHLNHIHILCLLSKKISQIKLLELVKKRPSKWIKTQDEKYSNFYWQDGYGIFSVSPMRVTQIAKYIKHQEEHHRTLSFEEELKLFLDKNDVEYDYQYLFS